MILNPYLVLAFVLGVAALPRNVTLTLAARHSRKMPATPCSTAVPYACDGGAGQFCCSDAAHCIEPSSIWSNGGWECRYPCEVFEQPCMNGLSCCPQDMKCGADGSCVPPDADPTSTVECDIGETPCGKSCCMKGERCDDSKGVCLASSDPKTTTLPPLPKNESSVTAHHRNESSGPDSSSPFVNSGIALADLSFVGLSTFVIFFSAVVHAKFASPRGSPDIAEVPWQMQVAKPLELRQGAVINTRAPRSANPRRDTLSYLQIS